MPEIAVIGMSCRFPQSPNLDGYWRTIREGRVCFQDIPRDRWDHGFFFSADRHDSDKTYGRKMGLIDDIRSFAPEYFGISPRRARVMDPQQRLLLDVARIALDDAGYGRRALSSESTGVFVGATVSEHKDIITSRLHVPRALRRTFGRVPVISPESRDAVIEDLVPMQAGSMVGQLLAMLAANVAQAFDFRGPALAVDTACSSSLVALHESVLHLRAGLIDAAIVGGVYLNLDCTNPVCFSRIGALSPSDRCRPFDSVADGFVLGEGAGVVVLKRLEDAIRDGDRIWSVIQGLAMNNDGRSEGPMAPRAEGQASVMRRAYRDAEVTPDVVGFLEAHGTATDSGDRVEMAALKDVFATGRAGPIKCAIGSVKANIGHTLAAAGVAGLIKAAMALEHGIIPPQTAFETPHPGLGLDGTGFWIPKEEHLWPCRADGSRFAGVSAFAFGGTNVHIVLKGPPVSSRVCVCSPASGLERRHSAPEPFLIAAPTSDRLADHLRELESVIRDLDGQVAVSDLAYTLTATRRHDRARVAFTASSHLELLEKLSAAQVAVRLSAAVGEGLWVGSTVPERARTELTVPARAEAGTQTKANLEAWCAQVVAGSAADPLTWFSGRALLPVWLPHPPLATREFWAVRDRHDEATTVGGDPHEREVANLSYPIIAKRELPRYEPSIGPSDCRDPDEITRGILDVVAQIGSYPPANVQGDQRLRADLGFDSLMVFDLLTHLTAMFPALGARTNELVEDDLTVEALSARVSTILVVNSIPAIGLINECSPAE